MAFVANLYDETDQVVSHIKFPWKWGWNFCFPPNIHCAGFVPNYDTSFDEFIHYLEKANIRHITEMAIL